MSSELEGTLLPFAQEWLVKFEPQALMISHKVIIRQSPVQMLNQFARIMDCPPGAARQFRHTLTKGQGRSLDEGCIDLAAQSCCPKAGTVIGRHSPDESLFDIAETLTSSMFDHLSFSPSELKTGTQPGFSLSFSSCTTE